MFHHNIPLSDAFQWDQKKMDVSKEESDLMAESMWKMKEKENKENGISDWFTQKNWQMNNQSSYRIGRYGEMNYSKASGKV